MRSKWLTKLHDEFRAIEDAEVRGLVEQIYGQLGYPPQGEPGGHASFPHTLAATYFAKKLCGYFSVIAEDKELILACCLVWCSGVGSHIPPELRAAEGGEQLRKLVELLRTVQCGFHQLNPVPELAMIVILSCKILSPQGPGLQISRSKDDGSFCQAA